MKDYYSILGVDKNASTEDIQKAFKKLALRWHPDRWVNGTDEEKKVAEEKFKEISEAKDILCDAQKRAAYDNAGMNDFGDMPDDMQDFMSNFFGRRMRNMQQKGDDYYASVTITTKEAFEGGRKSVIVEKQVKCSHCYGTGSESKTPSTCPYCGGKGTITETIRRSSNTIQMQTHPCQHCHGTGKIINDPCTHCHGSGTEIVNEYMDVEIPRGVADGMSINLPGLGGTPKNGAGINGDLILRITISDSDYFERADLTTIVHQDYIPFNEAMLGVHKVYKCIDGSTVRVDDNGLVNDGKQYRFHGKGMPNINDNRFIGDYVIIIHYVYPQKLTEKQKQLLKDFNK